VQLALELYGKSPELLVIGLACTGDQRAFAELVKRRQSWIRNLMRRCCGDDTLADDLAQQVFLQAWRNIRQLREPGSFGAWLKRLAISIWLQHQRKNDAMRGAEELAENYSTNQDTTSLAMDLDRALATLTGPVRLCIVLSYHERMSHGEIAALTEIPLGTVKSHIRRGTQNLKQLLSSYSATSGHEEAP
jgi:RNA polymerase sigma-70 factor (ECF subfamily)